MRVRWHRLYHLPSMIDTLEDLAEEVLRREEGESPLEMCSFWPPVDVYETAEGLIIEMELPGLLSDEVKLDASSGQLLVSGFKKDPDCCNKNYLLMERSFGRFRRLIRLPESLVGETARAEIKDGLLKVFFQKLGEGGKAPTE